MRRATTSLDELDRAYGVVSDCDHMPWVVGPNDVSIGSELTTIGLRNMADGQKDTPKLEFDLVSKESHDSTPKNEQDGDKPNTVEAPHEVTGKDEKFNQPGGGGTPAPARENDGAGRPEGSTSETPQGTGDGSPPPNGVVIATDARDKPHPEAEPEGGIPTPAGEPQGVLNQAEPKGEVARSARDEGREYGRKESVE